MSACRRIGSIFPHSFAQVDARIRGWIPASSFHSPLPTIIQHLSFADRPSIWCLPSSGMPNSQACLLSNHNPTFQQLSRPPTNSCISPTTTPTQTSHHRSPCPRSLLYEIPSSPAPRARLLDEHPPLRGCRDGAARHGLLHQQGSQAYARLAIGGRGEDRARAVTKRPGVTCGGSSRCIRWL